MRTFDWNGTEGPAGKSYDLLGDGSVVMVNIPGHSEGLCALKIKNSLGKYVLLFADGGYASKSRKGTKIKLKKEKPLRFLSLITIFCITLRPICEESEKTSSVKRYIHIY